MIHSIIELSTVDTEYRKQPSWKRNTKEEGLHFQIENIVQLSKLDLKKDHTFYTSHQTHKNLELDHIPDARPNIVIVVVQYQRHQGRPATWILDPSIISRSSRYFLTA